MKQVYELAHGAGGVERPVAFTPKGGCPLKPEQAVKTSARVKRSSIHPQGWVPVETYWSFCA